MNTFVGKQLEKMTLEFPFEDIKETEEEKKTEESKCSLIVEIMLKRKRQKAVIKISQ